MIYSLYVKEHNQTGLKYFGKTEQDPYQYRGSGKHWCRHLKKHGGDVSTYIIGTFNNLIELKKAGLDYSQAWNIVKSTDWANCVVEAGDGGPTMLGKKRPDSIERAKKMGLANKGKSCPQTVISNQKRKGIPNPSFSVLMKGNKYRKGIPNNYFRKINEIQHQCPHCGKTGKGPVMLRHHFDKCVSH